jgi:CO/xanthine dehydrogenase FAD-binding subunit
MEQFARHLVAKRTAPEELVDLNTIDHLDEVWGSLRIGSLTREEAEKLIVNQSIS